VKRYRLFGQQFSRQRVTESVEIREIALDEQRIAAAKNIWRRE
jgi:hypothetical protein